MKGFRDLLAEKKSRLEIVSELSGRGNINDALNTMTNGQNGYPVDSTCHYLLWLAGWAGLPPMITWYGAGSI